MMATIETEDTSTNRTEIELSPNMKRPPETQTTQTQVLKPPRKRRRKAVASGAPSDCFTCSKQGEECDRRRPYCSQCLDHGRECSGYKMNLTWGMGVASRGKMRGLSLPVLGAEPAGIPPKPQQKAVSRVSKRPPHVQTSSSTATALLEQSTVASTVPTATAYTAHPVASAAYPTRQQGFPGSSGLGGPGSAYWVPHTPTSTYVSPYQPIAGLGLASYPCKYESPHYPLHHQSAQAFPGLIPASIEQQQQQQHAGSEIQGTQREAPEQQREYYESDNFAWPFSHSPSYSQLLLARSVGRTPRLKYLISYYVEVIAPVIITFDSPTNPFRTHILRLAEDSEALQEAIASLSASNLRERRNRKTISTGRTLPSRMSCMAHRALTEGASQDNSATYIPEGIDREVLYHRGMAVKALNADLANPKRRLSDSVLATLLVLCLFHTCDTGIAKFETQFAGVKKLLALRMRGAKTASDELKWFIRMFTWFDTMTAAMNDREALLQDACLDIAAVSDGECPLENIAGCDANLFRLVAQVGRLNLRSQNKAVGTSAPRDMFMPTAPLPPSMLRFSPVASADNTSVSGAVNNYGFSMPSPPICDEAGQHALAAFWAEWFSLRQKLESWHFDPSVYCHSVTPLSATSSEYLSPPSSPCSRSQIAPENFQDIFHISESFRHSAILYCERLAYPNLPSSHPRFQSIVHLAMQHISAVQSDVYLLWPLFIVGSECVAECHRTAIRNRCCDISNDSGFSNNLSCLELLEKIWARELDRFSGAPAGLFWNNAMPGGWTPPQGQLSVYGRSGFRWHDVMAEKRGDGEYIVV